MTLKRVWVFTREKTIKAFINHSPEMLGHHHVRRQPLPLDSPSHFLLDHQSTSSFLVSEKRARTLHSGQVFRGNFVQN